MILTSHMLAHGSIVDSISEASYNQENDGLISRAEDSPGILAK